MVKARKAPTGMSEECKQEFMVLMRSILATKLKQDNTEMDLRLRELKVNRKEREVERQKNEQHITANETKRLSERLEALVKLNKQQNRRIKQLQNKFLKPASVGAVAP